MNAPHERRKTRPPGWTERRNRRGRLQFCYRRENGKLRIWIVDQDGEDFINEEDLI